MTTVETIKTWFDTFGAFGPWILALLIILGGYFVAKLIAAGIRKAIAKTNLDDRLANILGQDADGCERAISGFFFWLTMLFVVVFALSAAGQEAVVAPLTNVLNQLFSFLPGLLGALVIGFAAWILATVVKNLLVGLLSASRVDERLGLADSKPITNSVGLVAFFGIILMMLPTALSQLGLKEISDPIAAMVAHIFEYLPKFFAGIILIAIGYLIASIVQKVLSSVLSSIGTDKLPAKLGYRGEGFGGRPLSLILSYVAMATILVVITAQAFDAMDLGFISDLATKFVPKYFNVLGALLIFAFAFYAANLFGQLIEGRSHFWARVVRIAIIVFLGAVALQTADISPLTNEGFQFIISAVIVAAAFAAGVGGAIAIGLGGREKANQWLARFK